MIQTISISVVYTKKNQILAPSSVAHSRRAQATLNIEE